MLQTMKLLFRFFYFQEKNKQKSGFSSLHQLLSIYNRMEWRTATSNLKIYLLISKNILKFVTSDSQSWWPHRANSRQQKRVLNTHALFADRQHIAHRRFCKKLLMIPTRVMFGHLVLSFTKWLLEFRFFFSTLFLIKKLHASIFERKVL